MFLVSCEACPVLTGLVAWLGRLSLVISGVTEPRLEKAERIVEMISEIGMHACPVCTTT